MSDYKNPISTLWLKLPFLFDPVQRSFNGKFWEVTKEKFGKYGEGQVLDLACGTGEMRKYIHPKSYYGIDLNKDFIQFARKRFTDENTVFIAGDIIHSIPNKSFDTAFLISAAHHLSDSQMEMVLKSLKEKKVGKVLIIDGVPKGVISRTLEWLDDFLGGGEFFKGEKELVEITKKHYKIESRGTYQVPYSFYQYPYVIGTL